MKVEKIKKTIKENNLNIFTALDLERFLDISKVAAQKIAERYTKKEIFIRLKQGVYSLAENIPHSFVIANYIYKPSYISFESALSFYGMIPESFYTITSASSKDTKEFEAIGKSFKYMKIKEGSFVGYCKKEIDGEKVIIAEPEKALADYLYFVSLGKKELNSRLKVGNISQKKFSSYIEVFNRKNLKKISQEFL